MIFQYSPNAFYRVVFAMIGRIVGQLAINRLASGELNDPLDELSSAATIFWPVVSVDYYRVQIGLIFKCPPHRSSMASTIKSAVTTMTTYTC